MKSALPNSLPVILPEITIGQWRSLGSLVWWEATLGPARLVFTTRRGGVSAAPYDGLNLGLHVGDDPAAVIENRRAFWSAATGMSEAGVAPPVLAQQVHGAAVAVVGAADVGRGWGTRETEIPSTDALVTRERGVALGILVADCAPVALVSPEGVLGVAHAGWRGLASGVLEAALRQMEAAGAGSRDLYRAVVGPCIRGCCYEVGPEVWTLFPGDCLAPGDRPEARRLDLQAAVVHRLSEAGLPPAQIHSLGLCTACHPDLYFSHRRATQRGLAATGRMALVAHF